MPPKHQPDASRPRRKQETRSPEEVQRAISSLKRRIFQQVTCRTTKQEVEPNQEDLDDDEGEDSDSDSHDLGAHLGESDASDDGGLDADSDFEAKEDDGLNTIQLQAELLERLEREGSEGPGDAGFEEKSLGFREWAWNETKGMCRRMKRDAEPYKGMNDEQLKKHTRVTKGEDGGNYVLVEDERGNIVSVAPGVWRDQKSGELFGSRKVVEESDTWDDLKAVRLPRTDEERHRPEAIVALEEAKTAGVGENAG